MSYELVYSFGGHGGGYETLEEARKAAKSLLKGFNNPNSKDRIYIIPKDEKVLDIKNAVEVVTLEEEKIMYVYTVHRVRTDKVTGDDGEPLTIFLKEEDAKNACLQYNENASLRCLEKGCDLDLKYIYKKKEVK